MIAQEKTAKEEEHLVPESTIPNYVQNRNTLLKDIPFATIRKAWFTLSHILVPEGAHIVDMGCGDGRMSYVMAVLQPNLRFSAVDKNKRIINRAKELYARNNLEFIADDIAQPCFSENSLDAIINSYSLHEVYSSCRYNERIVSDTLEEQFKMLKTDGLMFIRDFSRPPPEEFVLLEIKDTPSKGNKLSELSEVDLLLWYSEHARPRQDPGCGGFFLEELPSRMPRTRLFRLPYKWAYEFIMRKDDREQWETELPMEYTFFTMRELRKELRSMGARVEYSAPHWDEEVIEKRFEGRIRLFEDDGTPIGDPPTSFVALARKMNERKSLHLEERRPAGNKNGDLRIFAMRDDKTGKLLDLVTRDKEIAEILPYTVTPNGRLKVFLHYGIARGIANAVPRSGVNLDGKRWSGHMIEPVGVDMSILYDLEELNAKNSALFARDYLGLKPYNNAILEHGQDHYPAPDFIDERVHTYYLEVVNPHKTITPKSFIGHTGKFHARGKIVECDAQDVINAITVGYIPNARLELQIMALFDKLNIPAETWTNKEIAVKSGKISSQVELRTVLRQLQQSSNRFKPAKGSAGQLRTVHSMFVEEGQSQGAIMGLSSTDLDFAVSHDKTNNIAVVLPLTAGLKKDVHAGFLIDDLPVPQRHEGKSGSARAPSFVLPPDITNLKMAKRFIADRFGVLPEMVFKLGEAYFSHLGVSPQKIHPFAVAAPPDFYRDTDITFFPMADFNRFRPLFSKEPHMFLVSARAYKFLHASIKSDMKRESLAELKGALSTKDPEWGYPEHFILPPEGAEGQDGFSSINTEASSLTPDQKSENSVDAIVQEQSQIKDSAQASSESSKEIDTQSFSEKEPLKAKKLSVNVSISNPNDKLRPEKW